MISDENELKWFFDHVIQRPTVNESYSMVFVCRHKKLTPEEKETLGLTRRESEFLATQSLRLGKFKDQRIIDNTNNWTFERFAFLGKYCRTILSAFLMILSMSSFLMKFTISSSLIFVK